MSLPVDGHRKEIVRAFRPPGLTLVIAPPGTGKSTRIPAFLSDEFPDEKIICVEPRRIAARSLAHRVASQVGESPGGTVGYRVRFDKKVSGDTRIEFVSRGVFLRQILEDPASIGRYGAILLDEFHERQLETDWIFGDILRRRSDFPDVRLGILSATLDPGPIRDLWPGARTVEVASPLHPVEVRHSPKPTRFDERTVAERTVQAVRALRKDAVPASYLVFLPGYREVRDTVNRLRDHPDLRGWDALPLTGEQSPEEQDRAIRDGPRPRVVVATNLAESSLTVEGVHAVVDGGLARRMDFDVSRGLNVLRTVRVSLFSARQRTGRAGRISEGVAVRLWSESEERDLAEAEPPECQRLDLSDWLLRAHFGGGAPDAFPWIDPPPTAHLEEAGKLLAQLGCLENGNLTEHGRAVARFPVHPRLASVILDGARRGIGRLAARLAALAEEDRLLIHGTSAEETYGGHADSADFAAELRLLDAVEAGYGPKAGQGARLTGARQILRQADRLARNLPPDVDADPEEKSERLRQACMAGFADRIARSLHRGTASYRCRDGTSARIDRHSRIRPGDWILFLEKRELTVKGVRTAVLGSIVNLEEDWIVDRLSEETTTETGVFEDPSGRLLRQSITHLGAIEVSRETLGPASDSERAAHFAKEALAGRIPLRKWTPATDHWLCRVECLRRHFPEFEVPDFDEEAKGAILEWVAYETATVKEFRNADIQPALEEWLGPELCPSLDRLLPSAVELPGRKRPVSVNYTDPDQPRLSLRIQDALRLDSHPTLASGRIRLTLELLAPNQRPVQVTDDLDAFWITSYPAIRKELRGRYPKHDWPENPKG